MLGVGVGENGGVVGVTRTGGGVGPICGGVIGTEVGVGVPGGVGVVGVLGGVVGVCAGV